MSKEPRPEMPEHCKTCQYCPTGNDWPICNARSFGGGMNTRIGPPVCIHDKDNKLPDKYIPRNKP